MKVGDFVETTRTFSPEDVKQYETLGGAPSEEGTLPEPLIGALFSYLLGVDLPGPGANYLKQESQYLTPAPVGEPVTARVEITRSRPEKHLVDLETTCRNGAGDLLCKGRALIYAEDVDKPFEID